MKKSQRLLLIAILLVGLFIFGIWFQAYRLLASPKVREDLVQKVQTLTEGVLHYQNFKVGYFFQPHVILEHPQLVFPNQSPVIEAEKLRFDFNIMSLLFGRAEVSAMDVMNGKTGLLLSFLSINHPIALENFSMQMGAFRPHIPIPVHFVSAIDGKPGALLVKGYVMVDSIEKWNWEKASGHLAAVLKGLSLSKEASRVADDAKRFFFFTGGQVDTNIEINKKSNESFLEFNGTGGGRELMYEMKQEKVWVPSPSFNAEWNVEGAWNNDTEELKLHKMQIKAPVGNFGANGNFRLRTGEIAGIHVNISDMGIEDLLKYWPGLEKALPFHIGFSGPCKWVMSLDGTTDHLSLHFNWDFTQTLLTYGEYFSKPKDIPLDVTFDCLVQKSEALSGDFSIKFEEMTLKGSLAGLDFATGSGQLNLLTNKFSIAGWEKYIPVLQKYKLGGAAKLLVNWKGDLRKLEQAERIFNITLEKGSWMAADGKGIRNADLILDCSPLMLEGRQMKFDIGNSPVLVDLKISSIHEKPRTEIKITSGEMKPREMWQAVASLCQRKEVGAGPDIYDQVKNSIEILFPQDHIVRDFSAEVHLQDNLWDVSGLKFVSYEGQVNLKGMVDLAGQESHYRFEGDIHNLNMSLFANRQEEDQKLLSGTLVLKGFLQGKGWGKEAWNKSLNGQGEFILKKGQFQTFDLKDILATIEPFSGIKDKVSSLKDFNDLDFRWELSEGKVSTDNLLVKYTDYVIDGKGTVDFEGLANFRLDVFLSTTLAASILPDMASALKKAKKAHVGPIPILLSGKFSAPEIKPDPAQVEGLIDKIRRKKAKDILYELVLE